MPTLAATWANLLVLFGLWTAITGGIWKLFERIEKGVSSEARRQATQMLKAVDVEQPLRALASTFNSAFDHVFGSRNLSWKRFLRSALASMFTVAVLLIVTTDRGFLVEQGRSIWATAPKVILGAALLGSLEDGGRARHRLRRAVCD